MSRSVKKKEAWLFDMHGRRRKTEGRTVLVCHKKKGSPDTCYHTDGPCQHHAVEKEAHPKVTCCRVHLHEMSRTGASVRWNVDEWVARDLGGGRWGWRRENAEGPLRGSGLLLWG